MTELDLDSIGARSDSATKSPWVADDTDLKVNTEDGRALVVFATVLLSDDDTRENHPQALADAEFIAHAREDVPALRAEVASLRQAVKQLIGFRNLKVAEVEELARRLAAVRALTMSTDGDLLHPDAELPVGVFQQALGEPHPEETRPAAVRMATQGAG